MPECEDRVKLGHLYTVETEHGHCCSVVTQLQQEALRDEQISENVNMNIHEVGSWLADLELAVVTMPAIIQPQQVDRPSQSWRRSMAPSSSLPPGTGPEECS